MGLWDRLRSEVIYLRCALRTLGRLKPIARNPNRTISDVVEALAADYGDRPALISDRDSYSFAGLNARANQYARWAFGQGIETGETVALFMHNRPEYLAIWMGIVRAGGVVALINTNLTGSSLAHSINIVAPRHIIVGGDLMDAIETVGGAVASDLTVWICGAAPGPHRALEPAVGAMAENAIPVEERPTLHINDPCLYIYTSGTTGLPKAANINHYRVQAIMFGFSAATNATAADRMYNCLPLYHTAGGLIAVGSVLTVGGSCVIRERFSASVFWDDIVKHQCTMFQYIGELCRYLVNSPTNPNESKHTIRLCNGNGLRPDIWSDFKTRFKLPQILEWYASTEGNAVFFNFDEKPGAVGRIPKWAERRFVTEVVAFDMENGTPVRGADGYCIKCAPNEVGEVISKILFDPSKPSQRFEGYSDKAATEKKILRDVFEPNDMWFTTGDLMRKDEHGYFYFVDRIGDTFRWKGENVATSEVSEAITVFPGIQEANVYGVHVNGHDGRAGMAALVIDGDLDLAAFREHLNAQLPEYARPIFVRLTNALDLTGTFKMKKIDFVKDGFDPMATGDDIYVYDRAQNGYRRVDQGTYDAIQDGVVQI